MDYKLKTISILLIILITPVISFSKTQFVRPNVDQTVIFSNIDANWVYCEEGINNVQYFDPNKNGDQVDSDFLSYNRSKRGKKNQYMSLIQKTDEKGKKIPFKRRFTLYIECGDDVFKLKVKPRKVSGRSIVLKTPRKVTREERSFSELPMEAYINRLMPTLYKGEIKPGWDIKTLNKPFRVFEELSLFEKKRIDLPSKNLRIREFVLFNPSKTPISIQEKQFRRSILIENPVRARSIENLVIFPNEYSRVWVFETVDREQVLGF